MRRNRLILCAVIIAAGIFASFYGGNVAYALFYITLTVPAASILYTIFVYCRFCLYQKIEQKRVLKGELIPYEFTLSNEDVISYTNIKVNFFTDRSSVLDTGGKTEYLLLPGESNTLKTMLCCKYRGEYNVGVESVVITDYLFLFSITYPIITKLNLTVLPRVFSLDKLKISQDEQDPKKTNFHLSTSNEQLDTDVRKYSGSDSRKLIHWKASAKKHELLSRRYTDNAKTRIMLMMDLAPVKEHDLDKIIIEDKIIESTLSITDYYKNNSTNIVVCYDSSGLIKENISNVIDFEVFYQNCAYFNFNSKLKVENLLYQQITDNPENFFGIIITHSITSALYDTSMQAVSRGIDLTILFVSDDSSNSVKQLIQNFNSLGIRVFRINSDDSIIDVLSA